MKKILLLSFSISIILFGCKKKDDGLPSEEDIINLHNATMVNANTRAQFLELAPQSGNPKQTLIQTLDWALAQEGVAKAFHQDSTYLFIEMSSGLQTMLWVNELDAEGKSKYRGGGSGELKDLTSTGNCSNVVENKDVLIYAPGAHEFAYEFRSAIPGKLEADERLGTVRFLKDEQANVDAISTFSDYGLVLIETHGTAISFMTGDGFYFGESEVPTQYRDFRDRLIEQIGDQNLERMINSELIIGSQVNYDPLVSSWWSENQFNFESGTFKLWASAKFLENGPSLSNTIVYGNFCFSGWTTIVPDYPKPIGKAILDLNPRTYYAYQTPDGNSRVVDNFDSMALEDSTITGLLNENDSTGNAHLKADGNPFQTTFANLYLVQMGQPDWCYEGCGGNLVYMGQTYRTVCIGDQVWMAENLNYEGAGLCYGNDPSNCDAFGRLYSIYETTQAIVSQPNSPVQGICPDGWHVPSRSEFNQLIDAVGGQSAAGNNLKADSIWSDVTEDAFGFRALPAGRWTGWNGPEGINTDAYFWTSSQLSGGYTVIHLENGEASVVVFHQQDENAQSAPSMRASCRCVKD